MSLQQEQYGFIKNTRDGLSTITITTPQGQPHTITSDNASYEDVLRAWREGRKADAVSAISIATAIKQYTKGAFEIVGNEVHVNGRAVPDTLADYILDFKKDGLDFMPLVKFAENLFLNPSYRSVKQLFGFLTTNQQPITEDGCFIAYKRVGSDFLDLYTHTMCNAPGEVLKMDRNEVDDDPNRTCSKGLHVANWHYANSQYGNGQGVMLSVKVNPADVVAVPTDYNQAKMRVCEYTVIEVLQEALSSRLVSSTGGAYQSFSCISDEEEEEEEDEFDDEDLDDEDEEEDDCGSYDCPVCNPCTGYNPYPSH